jgi:uncharacterized membrane protein
MKAELSHKRHVLKTITWRIIGTIDTILFDPTIGLSVGGAELTTKMILYYIHERAWYRVDFGVKRRSKDENLSIEDKKG